MANMSIRLSTKILHEAQAYSKIFNRSVPKQIEYWSKIGKLAEENPDLTYADIKDILIALEEKKLGDVTEYKFDS